MSSVISRGIRSGAGACSLIVSLITGVVAAGVAVRQGAAPGAWSPGAQLAGARLGMGVAAGGAARRSIASQGRSRQGCSSRSLRDDDGCGCDLLLLVLRRTRR